MKDPRFKNRRRMAWIAFLFMLIISGWMVHKGVTNEEAAARIEQLSFLLGSVFGLCTSIVLAYYTSSSITDYNDPKA